MNNEAPYFALAGHFRGPSIIQLIDRSQWMGLKNDDRAFAAAVGVLLARPTNSSSCFSASWLVPGLLSLDTLVSHWLSARFARLTTPCARRTPDALFIDPSMARSTRDPGDKLALALVCFSLYGLVILRTVKAYQFHPKQCSSCSRIMPSPQVLPVSHFTTSSHQYKHLIISPFLE